MKKIVAFFIVGLMSAPVYAEDICSDREAYRFGHEGRGPAAACTGSERYMHEYRRGEFDGRAAVSSTVGTGIWMDDSFGDDDFYHHHHYHHHNGNYHSHRHRHHNEHNGEHHGNHPSHHFHHANHSGGYHGGGGHHGQHGGGSHHGHGGEHRGHGGGHHGH